MKINITADAMKRMFLWAQHAKGEVSGLGDITVVDGELAINNVYLFPQECSGGETDMDWDAVTNFLAQFPAGSPEAMAKRLWWHSHADMSAFLSGTDKETITSWGKQGVQYLVSIVVNKKREVFARYDCFKPIHIYTESIKLWVMDDENEGLYQETKQQVEEMVREKTVTMSGGLAEDEDYEKCEYVGNDGKKYEYYRLKPGRSYNNFKYESRQKKDKGDRKSFFSHLPEEDKKELYEWFDSQEWRSMTKAQKKATLKEMGYITEA